MRAPSPAEPVTELRRVKIIECGEPMIDFLENCPELVMDEGVFTYTRSTFARKTVAEALCKAAKSLPKGYRLGIIEAWRPPYIQRRMVLAVEKRFREANPDWSEVKLRRVVNRFTAPLDARVPPPHTTGGAVDVRLLGANGNRLDCTSPYEFHDEKGFPMDAPGLTEQSRRNRQILKEAMLAGGLTNYPSEYWHWSYGDQGWAYRGGHPHALYGPITPPNWSPIAQDAIEEPLVFKVP
jgi:D-alanyl-D-alanine dipeptidase